MSQFHSINSIQRSAEIYILIIYSKYHSIKTSSPSPLSTTQTPAPSPPSTPSPHQQPPSPCPPS